MYKNTRKLSGADGAMASLPLTIGERVVLLRDGDAEYGYVRWIGRIPGYSHSMVGMEFDNPVGSGSGNYNGTRLFTTKINHAALVPIEGLLRAVDYDRETTEFETLQKDLLIDFNTVNNTSLWTADREPEPKSTYLIDVSDPVENGQAQKTPVMDTRGICVGTLVEVSIFVNITTPDLRRYGVVRWIGSLPGIEEPMAGVELETDLPYWVRCATDGYYRNVRYFFCSRRRGVFVPFSCLHIDFRAPLDQDLQTSQALDETMPKFPRPWRLCDLHLLIGKRKGIQGKQNSCYMDATLFALFTASDAYDQRGYVENESVMKLRRLLSYALPDMTGLTTEEKDPEELINAVFGPILRVDPDVHLTSGQSSYICSLITDDAFPKAPLTSVQTLLERSFFCSNVQLQSMPNRFIVQLPRYGKQKLYDYIVPTLQLDLSNVLRNRGRICCMCRQPAQWQCKECYLVETTDYSMTFFCNICFGRFHSALRRHNDHRVTPIPRSSSPVVAAESACLELSSVICIESSHYVSFVRARDGCSTRWLFFDSMADREGGDITGHNIPEVTSCDDYFDEVLKPENRHLLVDALPLPVNRKSEQRRRFVSNPLPPFMERLLQDCYICVYVRPV